MFRKFKISKIFLLYLIWNLSFANQTYYTNHQEGWYWYREAKVGKNKNINQNPVQTMEYLKKQVTYNLDKAILNPTPENLRNYMEIQNFITNKSSEFSNTWQKVLLENPNLDYSLTHPTTSLGRQVYLNQYSQKIENSIHDFAAKYGLFFFYKADCPYCEMMAPILKNFTTHYKISLIPVSNNANFLTEFPESKINSGQIENLNINIFPALFAIEPKNKKIIPISYGFMTEDLLCERILKIMSDFKDDI